MKARKQKEAEFCDDFDKAGKYIDASVKNIRNFCQKGSLTTDLQHEFGDYLKELGLENDDELGETLIKLGDCLKSMATLNHVMLCNMEEHFIQPLTEFRKDLNGSDQLSSAELYAKKCLKQEEHMRQLLQFFMCYYHYYSEGYTLTYHLKEPLEKIKDRSVKNVIAMRDQVMEELKNPSKKKALPSPPTSTSSTQNNNSYTSNNSYSSNNNNNGSSSPRVVQQQQQQTLKRQDSALSGAQFKKAPPIPKQHGTTSSISSINSNSTTSSLDNNNKYSNGYHTHQYNDVSSISNRSSSSSSTSDESFEPPKELPKPVITPRSAVVPPKPKPRSPTIDSTTPESPKPSVDSTPSTITWKKPTVPTIKRNDSFTTAQPQPVVRETSRVEEPRVEPVMPNVVYDSTTTDNNNNSNYNSTPTTNSTWKKPTAPTIKRNDSFISQPVVVEPPVVELVMPNVEYDSTTTTNNSNYNSTPSTTSTWKKPTAPTIKRNDSFISQSPEVEPPVTVEPVKSSVDTTSTNNNNNSSWKKPIAPTIKRNDSFTTAQSQPVVREISRVEEPRVEPVKLIATSNNTNNNSSTQSTTSGTTWRKPTAPNLKKKEEPSTTESPQPANSEFIQKKASPTGYSSKNSNIEPTNEDAVSSNNVSSFKKNLENSIQFRLPGMSGGGVGVGKFQQSSPASTESSPPSSQETTSSKLNSVSTTTTTNGSSVNSRPISKPPVPQSRRPVPSYLAKCKALYPYTAQGEGEITFKPGDIVLIFEKEGDFGWWTGSLESDPEKKGIFPSNYVQII